MSTATENIDSPSACDRLLDYVYGELAGDALDEFKLHLLGCEKCKRELAGLERVRTAVKQAMPAVEPAADKMAAMHAQLMHAAAQQKPKRGKVLMLARRMASHPAYAMAAMFAIVCGVVTLNWSMGRMAMPVAEKALHEPMAPAPVAGPTTVTTEEPGKPVGAVATPPAAEPVLVPAHKPIETFANDKTVNETKITLQTGAPAAPAYAVKRAPARKEAPQEELLLDGVGKGGEGGGRGAYDAPKRDSNADDSFGGLSRRHASGGADLNQGYSTDQKKKAEPSRSAPVVAAAPPPAPPAKFADLEKDERQAPMGAKNQAPPTVQPAPPAQNQASSPSLAAAPEKAKNKVEEKPQSPTETRMAQQPAPQAKAAIDPAQLKKRAEELASANRCDEAVPLYQQLDRQSPTYMSPKERLNYVRCLRMTGRDDAADAVVEREKKANVLRQNANGANTNANVQNSQNARKAGKAKAAAPASTAPADSDKAADKAAY